MEKYFKVLGTDSTLSYRIKEKSKMFSKHDTSCQV